MNASTTQNSTFSKKLTRTFLAGLLAALPLVLTLAAVVWLLEFLKRFLGPNSAFGNMMGSIGLRFVASETAAYIIGVALILALIYFLGLLVQTRMRNHLQRFVDNLIERLPVVRTIYNALKKLMQMFDVKDESDIKAMSAVMCHFGGKGSGTAVLALLPSPDIIHLNGKDYYAILIPTAPVPFGGAILYVPVEWVESADINFDGLLNVYMSMGATSQDYFNKQADVQKKAD